MRYAWGRLLLTLLKSSGAEAGHWRDETRAKEAPGSRPTWGLGPGWRRNLTGTFTPWRTELTTRSRWVRPAPRPYRDDHWPSLQPSHWGPWWRGRSVWSVCIENVIKFSSRQGDFHICLLQFMWCITILSIELLRLAGCFVIGLYDTRSWYLLWH